MNKEVIIYDKNEKPIKISIENFEDVDYIELFIIDRNEELRVTSNGKRITLPQYEAKVRPIPMLRTCIYDKLRGINLLDNERWVNRFNDKYENKVLQNFKLEEITDEMHNNIWIRYTLGCRSDVPGNWYLDIFFEDKSGHIMNDNILLQLIAMPNVIITSHQAFLTNEALDNIAETTINNVISFFENNSISENEVCYHCSNMENCKKKRKEKCF